MSYILQLFFRYNGRRTGAFQLKSICNYRFNITIQKLADLASLNPDELRNYYNSKLMVFVIFLITVHF